MHKTLTQGFSTFLRRRRAQRHFERRPLLDTLAAATTTGATSAAAPSLGQSLLTAGLDEPAQALARLNSQADGLDTAEAARRLARDGPNEVQHEPPLPGWLRLWRCYLNPFNLLLTALALLSFISADGKATVVIGVMVALSTGIRFVQEGRSHRAAEGLRAMVTTTAAVIRRSAAPVDASAAKDAQAPKAQEIPVRQLVSGDVVVLSAGDMIPADCRVLSARDLFVAQAAMTGESLPVEKFVQPVAPGVALVADAGALDQRNLVFMGTNVVSGTATALVVATGGRSYFGTLAAHATATETTPNVFQAGVNSVSWLLIRFAAVMVPIVFFVNGFTKGDWLQAFLFALSVAVGLTPEMLPMIVTSTLAKGAVLLSRKKVVVKRLDAIQNFGAMDILCTDKTGTLTEARVTLTQHVDHAGAESARVYELAFLNSHFETGLRSPLDDAILAHATVDAAAWRKIDEVPFDFARRRVSVLLERGGARTLIVKGAPEDILGLSTEVEAADGTVQSMTPTLRAALRDRFQQIGSEGMRALGVASRGVAPDRDAVVVDDEAELVFAGFAVFVDPPKASAGPALRALAAAGIAVKVLTGDDERVARHLCAELGLAEPDVITGPELASMSDEALLNRAVDANLFCRVTPPQKLRVLLALKRAGRTVGFLGDGINDAPALHAADVGISVDTAADVAKAAAQVILLEPDLGVLHEGVMEGRRTVVNIDKYILMASSANLGNIGSMVIAGMFLPFLPLLPIQVLLTNLVYDCAQLGLPMDNVDAETIQRPVRWDIRLIERFMLVMGPVSTVFDVLTFGVLIWVFHAGEALFRTGWFLESLVTQILMIFAVRTRRHLFASRPRPVVAGLALGAAVVTMALPFVPVGNWFEFVVPPIGYYGFLLVVVAVFLVSIELVKRLFFARLLPR